MTDKNLRQVIKLATARSMPSGDARERVRSDLLSYLKPLTEMPTFFATSRSTGHPVSANHLTLQDLLMEMRLTESNPENVYVYRVMDSEVGKLSDNQYSERFMRWKE